VPPSVHVVADPPSPVEVNKTVNFTCHVKGFYPKDVVVTWLENGTEMKVQNISQPLETPQGLFELSSSLVEVKAMEEKNGSVFTCRVVHDAQETISKMATLQIADPAREQQSDLSAPGNGLNLLASLGFWIVILLEKGLLGGLLIFLFK
ncbi:SIRB1 protein, partial [Sula dactylatra]|nr:SIRB1 protein [Sula dactylatra]